MSYVIEKAVPKDAEAILQYLKQVGGETDNLTFGEEGVPFTVEEEAEYLAGLEASKDSIMLVAKEDGAIIGCANLNRQPRRMSHRGGIGLSVLKAYWNRGIGGQLIESLIEFAKSNGVEIVDLQVRSDNAPAIHLYEKYGFVKIGTHPAFHKIGEEELAFDYMCMRIK